MVETNFQAPRSEPLGAGSSGQPSAQSTGSVGARTALGTCSLVCFYYKLPVLYDPLVGYFSDLLCLIPQNLVGISYSEQLRFSERFFSFFQQVIAISLRLFPFFYD